ncbi:hypothetical protein F3Y22_tig00110384pilonHSYRG00911 [Hibiscus syriacus]|uniref:Uncharacterized protein n=1 Tax=Hibiscus syriacus TaxID=106335 RepID=A0A6A3AXD7_HIBSY|nr:hypothetical protein F3Y22_tig00110384pilonHSYRG00911 [Hibiscus syriacus]
MMLDPTGNITIKWDVISWTPDGYVAVVTMYNFQQYRHIQSPGWTLGGQGQKEVSGSMMGSQTTSKGMFKVQRKHPTLLRGVKFMGFKTLEMQQAHFRFFIKQHLLILISIISMLTCMLHFYFCCNNLYDRKASHLASAVPGLGKSTNAPLLVYSHMSVESCVQHPNFDNLTNFSAQLQTISPYAGLMKPVLSGMYNRNYCSKRCIDFHFRKGMGFSTEIYFNGDNCVMHPPDAYPVAKYGFRPVISLLQPAMTILASCDSHGLICDEPSTKPLSYSFDVWGPICI